MENKIKRKVGRPCKPPTKVIAFRVLASEALDIRRKINKLLNIKTRIKI